MPQPTALPRAPKDEVHIKKMPRVFGIVEGSVLCSQTGCHLCVPQEEYDVTQQREDDRKYEIRV